MLQIGQILNIDDRRVSQIREMEHMHAPIHVVDSTKIEENKDNEVVK